VHILLDSTNPGLWMAHCHISEHQLERNDVQAFNVDPAGRRPAEPHEARG
jgi:FtsP/CotA-like multicopper oxidase with cupredoxin domain